MGPIGAEMKRLTNDSAHIDAVLADGAARARTIARETVEAVKTSSGSSGRRKTRFCPRKVVDSRLPCPGPAVRSA
jgi:hypothetical protein